MSIQHRITSALQIRGRGVRRLGADQPMRDALLFRICISVSRAEACRPYQRYTEYSEALCAPQEQKRAGQGCVVVT